MNELRREHMNAFLAEAQACAIHRAIAAVRFQRERAHSTEARALLDDLDATLIEQRNEYREVV